MRALPGRALSTKSLRHIPPLGQTVKNLRDATDSKLAQAANEVKRVGVRGNTLLTQPRWNKGTAFTNHERWKFGLTGRLPIRVNTLEDQCKRAYEQLHARDTPLRKSSFLQSMKDQNWVLYYGLLSRHIKELVPIVYTPTAADAIANYSHLFRRSEGLFLTFTNMDTMEEDYLEQTKGKELDLIVCSDGEAILGIGDQGLGGIGIATAKSTIYTLIGRVDPARALAVAFDVGTDNEALRSDPLYVGWPHERVRGRDYDIFIDRFIQIVRKHNPHCLIHFEDFGVSNAQRILDKYRDKHAMFNDDVQGTGAVTLSALMSAIGVTQSKLHDQRILIYGAGSAGLGITHAIRNAMSEIDDIPLEDANNRFYLMDRYGLITESLKKEQMRPGHAEFARPADEWADASKNEKGEVGLLEVVKRVKPTVLIGCSTHAGAFTEEVVKAMAEGVERPIIFPLSNPSRLVEVDPKLANEWTGGKALLATGSPFPPAKMPNGKEYIIAECNNALIYPGLGLGSVVARSRTVTDGMILAGARRLASLSPALKDPDDALLPDITVAPEVNFEVAIAVAEHAIEEGVAEVDFGVDEVRARVKAREWVPVYPRYEYDPEAGAE
ncbi:hypothetical protein PENSPDRAFT_658478 [Peniophora sp. CONT]|nr:hypothetical protein PENSPDRAFT_658478 [Peniophora sp. CONT]